MAGSRRGPTSASWRSHADALSGHRAWKERVLLHGGPGRLDERGLQPARGVEVVAGPDHPHGGGGGLAVRRRAGRGGRRRRAGRRRPGRAVSGSGTGARAGEAGGEVARTSRSSARCWPAAPRGRRRGRPPAASSRCHRSSTASPARRRPDDAGDEAGDLGERDRLGAALGEVAAEGVVEPARGRRGAQRLVGSARAAGACDGVAAPHAELARRRRGSSRCRRRPRPAPGRARRRRRAARTAGRRARLTAQPIAMSSMRTQPDLPALGREDVEEDQQRDA